MGYNNPSIDDFKSYFFRDFPFGTDPNTSVLDQDIGNAFLLTNVNWNTSLWCSQENYTLGYFYLSAHFLVLNLRASSQGINGQFAWLESSKGVGSVNTSLSIPDRILEDPTFSLLSKTNYGMMYLGLLLPQLAGQMTIVPGSTRP